MARARTVDSKGKRNICIHVRLARVESARGMQARVNTHVVFRACLYLLVRACVLRAFMSMG